MAARCRPTAVSLLSLAVHVALALAAVPAAAQQSGGEAPDGEVVSAPSAAQVLRERAVLRLQILQSVSTLLLRATGAAAVVPPGGIVSASPHDALSPHDAVNPNTAVADRAALNAQDAVAAAAARRRSQR